MLALDYPKTWNYIVKDTMWGRSVTFLSEDHKNSKLTVTLSIRPMNGLVTLEEYSKDLRMSIARNSQSVKILEEGEAIMLNSHAYKILYEFERDGKKIRKMSILSLKNKVSYIFDYESNSNEFLNLKSIPQNIGRSLRFLN